MSENSTNLKTRPSSSQRAIDHFFHVGRDRTLTLPFRQEVALLIASISVFPMFRMKAGINSPIGSDAGATILVGSSVIVKACATVYGVRVVG